MRKCTLLLIATMLILPTQLTAQTTEGYIPANLGRIVEVATPNGVLSRPHVLIGWDTNGFVKQANSLNTYKIFGSLPSLTTLQVLNESNRFGAPSSDDCYEIRFGNDSSRYWINLNAYGSGGNLASNQLPFSVYHVGPKSPGNTSVTGGTKLCIKVSDQDGNGIYTPGERIFVFADLAMPLDSIYDSLSYRLTNPFTSSKSIITNLRFGLSSIPYAQTTFNLPGDGSMPPSGTVIRFMSATSDSSQPCFTIKDITQDTGTHSHSNLISYYSYEKPRFQLVQAPPRMTIDTNGVITWTTMFYQAGNTYDVKLKATNSCGITTNSFIARAESFQSSLPADTGIVEYKTETAGNRIRFWQRNDGSIGYRASQTNFGMEYPIGTNTTLIYAGGLYIGGLKKGGAGIKDTVTVSECEFESEYQPGRILNTGPFGGLIAENFHVLPTFASLPENSSHWPREAPRNAFGLPLRLSGKDTWTVFNDLDIRKARPDQQDPNEFSPGLGIEVQRQTFQYSHYPFNNAVLVRYVVINRSNRQYDSCYFGYWNDPDVGDDSGDDLTSVDSALSLMTVYSNPTGSDNARTTAGVLILQGPVDMGSTMDTARIQTIGKEGFESKNIPHKVNRMANAANSYGAPAGEPSRLLGDQSRYWYMKGLEGNDGLPKPGGPFDPTASGRIPGDQRGIFSTGPFNFAAGDTQEVWMAYIGGQGVNNASSIDTVRHYAEWIMNDFKNNQIYKFDKTAPSLSLHGLSTQAVNRVRFMIGAGEPLMQTILRTTTDTLKLSPVKNGYAADYNISKTGSVNLTLTGKDIAGNASTITKTYQVTSLNKPAVHEKYTFHPNGQGYLLMSKAEASSIPDKCMLIGEPVEWIATQNNESMKVEFEYSNYDLGKIQSRYEEVDVMNLGLYSWDGEKWVPVETSVSSNKLNGMAKGNMMAVFYNPESNNTPKRFSLEPNYPNPFNPSTTIRYQLAENNKVMLKVYNLLGQEVKTLVNTQQSSGIHSVVWDGTNNFGQRVTSGVYFYRLQAGDFVKTRKMVLVK